MHSSLHLVGNDTTELQFLTEKYFQNLVTILAIFVPDSNSYQQLCRYGAARARAIELVFGRPESLQAARLPIVLIAGQLR